MLSAFQEKRIDVLEKQDGFEHFCSNPRDREGVESYRGPIAVLYYFKGHLHCERLGQSKILISFGVV